MQTQTRDIQFETFIEDLTNALDLSDLGFAFGVLETIGASVVALYDAFAQAEPGVVTAATKGLVV